MRTVWQDIREVRITSDILIVAIIVLILYLVHIYLDLIVSDKPRSFYLLTASVFSFYSFLYLEYDFIINT